MSFTLSLIGVWYHILLLEQKTELVSSTKHRGGVSLAKRVLSGVWDL